MELTTKAESAIPMMKKFAADVTNVGVDIATDVIKKKLSVIGHIRKVFDLIWKWLQKIPGFD